MHFTRASESPDAFHFWTGVALLLALSVVVFGLICVISSGHPTSTSFSLALLASLLNLLLYALALICWKLLTE